MSNPRSTEYLIGTPTGIKTSRTIWRVPPSERWNIDLINKMRGKPWEWTPKENEEEGTKAQPKPAEAGPPMPEGSDYKERNPRGQRVRITKADVRLYNPTIGCPGCAAVADKRKAENHSESCRARFVEIFQKTEDGRKRLEEAN